jgi:hypothetical protein
MEFSNTDIFVLAATVGTAVLLLTIYTGQQVIRLFKAKETVEVPLKPLMSNIEAPDLKTIERRKRPEFPGVTCSLPIHQTH